ncbi:MAG TPA: alpha-2-macroglobulin family protein, partial [Arenimonas sp.]|nr:alpha-2-macroglobulin family protein [Arenimonas sp.]
GGQRVSRQFELTVRPAWPGVVSSRAQQLAPDARLNLGTAELAGLMADTATLRLTVSTHPPIPYARALQELLAYPYGCVEQTTTRGFAALLLDADTAARMGISGLDDNSRRQRLEGALGRLAALQLANGHFAFWGGGDSAVPILTPYIAEFLLLARDAGFAVPESVLQKTLERLSEDLLSGGLPFYAYDQADHLRLAYQAHAGYVLATLNRAPLGTLRALWDNQRDKALSGLPLLHLGLALQAQGDAGRGAQAIAAALARKDARPRWLGDYGSALRDRAQMLALLQQHGLRPDGFDDQLLALSRELQARPGDRYWLSTQEQIALARLGKGLLTEGDSRIAGAWALGDAREALPERRSFSRDFHAAELARGLRLHSTAASPLFVSVDVAGVPSVAPKADDSAVSVQRRWFHADGKPWQGGPLREGQSLVAALRVESRETMADALLVDLLPAGLEIENLNLTDPAQWSDVVIEGVTLSERSDAAQIQHEEYRDDRYVAALKLQAGQPAQLFYLVRAVTPGTYVAPPPQVEDMYRPMLRGVGEPRPASITVLEP